MFTNGNVQLSYFLNITLYLGITSDFKIKNKGLFPPNLHL